MKNVTSYSAQLAFAQWRARYGSLAMRAGAFTLLWVVLTLVLVGDMLGTPAVPSDLQALTPLMVARS
jgi:hypothetical protein